jgi:ABC-2 type transport system permease protein
MPIFDQGYQHWQGELSGRAWRWWTITWHGVRAGLKNKWLRMILFLAWVPALGLSLWLIFWGLVENRSSLVMPLIQTFGLPANLPDIAGQYRETAWTMAYYYFFNIEMFFVMILVLIAGPNLISQDLRFNAMPLYLSRPLRRFDYFLGKLGVIAVFAAAVAIGPAVLAYLLGAVFSLDLRVVVQSARFLGASLVYGVVMVLAAGMLILALSSLSRNARYVGLMWAGIWLVGDAFYGVLAGGLRWEWGSLVSFKANVGNIGATLLNVGPALRQMFGRMPPPQREEMIASMLGPPNLWMWSSLVLACVIGLSLWILSSRVKSLDRLR